jgi:transaldolase/glucose-6-phosphate isomerase
VRSTANDWQSGGKVKRLWQRDASLWTNDDESKWLGWLDIVEEQLAQHEHLQKVAKDVQMGGFQYIQLLGMGGIESLSGGPNSGVFLQITCDDSVELPVPGQKYTFDIVKAAQARGDFQVLAERGRRALRLHLGKDLKSGLATLISAVQKALQ